MSLVCQMDTKTFTLHLGAQDSAPGMDSLAYIVADSFAPEGQSSVSHPKTFEEMDLGWNCVYPFSTVSLKKSLWDDCVPYGYFIRL